MKTTVTIRIDDELLHDTARCFGVDTPDVDYSEIIEHALLYFLKPQLILTNKAQISAEDHTVEHLLIEPEINIEEIEKNYHFDVSTVEGQWPSDESAEQLISLLHP